MELVGEDLSVRHPQWARIHVRNKRPAGQDAFAPDRVVILQHGATYGSAAFSSSWKKHQLASGPWNKQQPQRTPVRCRCGV